MVALGGGGLLCGVLQGLHEVGWGDIPVVAMETFGADSLAECCRQNKWTEIPAITRWITQPCTDVICLVSVVPFHRVKKFHIVNL